MLDLYIRVCVLSANLAQNRVRLIHGIDLYMSLYGSSDVSKSVLQRRQGLSLLLLVWVVI